MTVDWNKLREEREKDKTRFYIAISGDVAFNKNCIFPLSSKGKIIMLDGYELLDVCFHRVLRTRLESGFEVIISTGDNNGIDSLATEYAMRNNYKCLVTQTDWDKNGNRAGYIRNEDIFMKIGLKTHKGSLIMWDGENPYTKNLIYQSYQFSAPCKVYDYKRNTFLTSEEIFETQMDVKQEQARYGKL